ncbi:hypothetical protein BgiBS90_035501 [Biomphalaria glabrata]|nr:hypothetical protein BgiBS90_035501 [Biomphalaria glabrata]
MAQKWTIEIESITNAETAWQECKKICNHKHYIEPSQLEVMDMPRDARRFGESLKKCIMHMSTLTCRVQNGTRMCTGLVQRVRKSKVNTSNRSDCPDPNCSVSRTHEIRILTVTSVSSIIKPRSRDQHIQLLIEDFNCHYHFSGIKSEGEEESVRSEWCELIFITHNIDNTNTLPAAVTDFEESQRSLYEEFQRENYPKKIISIIGYPHGPKKMVSFGEIISREPEGNIRGDLEWCVYRYDAPTCSGFSGATLLIPGQPLAGYGYWFGHPHCHYAYDDNTWLGRSSIGCDHRSRTSLSEPWAFSLSVYYKYTLIVGIAIVSMLVYSSY